MFTIFTGRPSRWLPGGRFPPRCRPLPRSVAGEKPDEFTISPAREASSSKTGDSGSQQSLCDGHAKLCARPIRNGDRFVAEKCNSSKT